MIGRSVDHNFYIHARRMYDRLGVQLYLYQRLGDNRLRAIEIEPTEFGPVLKQTTIETREGEAILLDEGSKFKPFMIIDEPMYRELLSAMQRLADEEGVPRPSEDHLRGKLEATQVHLADMRRLLFEPMTQRIILEKSGEIKKRKGITLNGGLQTDS